MFSIHQRADMAFNPTKIWESDIDHIDYSIPIYVDELKIICSYNYTDHFVSADLIHAYLDFHWSYYASFIFTVFGLVFAWKICADIASKMSHELKKQLINSRLPSYWILVCAIFDQGQYPNVSRAIFPLLSICTTIFVFIVIDCFMKNVMSADLSVMTQPRVIQTYQDILEREHLQLMFIPGWAESDFFEFAPVGSIESKIWKKRYILNEISAKTIGKVWQPVIDQEIILVARNQLAMGAANLGLTKMIEMGNDLIRALATTDETGKAFTNAQMIQKDAPKVLKDFCHQR